MKLGFTGTAKGMSARQLREFEVLIRGAHELHHGDCVGADEQAHRLTCFVARAVHIVVHPPSDDKARAYCSPGPWQTSMEVVEPKPYIQRNHDIVDAVDLLVAAPYTDEEVLRSGTWATVRYARKVGTGVVILSR